MVTTRRKKGELTIAPLTREQRARALELAGQLFDLAETNVGQTRDELVEAWSAVRFGAREKKLADGLRKLVEDGLEFEVVVDKDPVALRREVFELATAQKKALSEEARFDRDALLAQIAARHGIEPEALEKGLYGDLKGAHVLKRVAGPPPRAIVEGYDLEQARAVLLRAVHMTIWISGASPGALRTLFRRLKFQRLLYTVAREPNGRFRIEVDGPFSLFESVTKYGLQLAIALPALLSCGQWALEAQVRWGKQRTPMIFKLEGDARRRAEDGTEDGAEDVPERLPDEVQALLDRFAERKSAWTARVADDILDLPGIGLCVPDLAFTHEETGEVVYLEVMGFWSRDAVWKRVELVQAGLKHKILFAASSRLRVSEAVLDDAPSAALYVYKGAMSPKQIEEKLDGLT